MEPEKLIETLAVAERLKDATRHCYTSRGRRESVAEHSLDCLRDISENKILNFI